jgi:hypothetical protein
MAAFLISQLDEDLTLYIDPEFLIKAIQEQWPNTDVIYETTPSSHALFSWIITCGNRDVICTLPKEHHSLWLEGGDIAEYGHIAAWFRRIIQPSYRLWLYEQGLGLQIELKPGITEQDIIRDAKSSMP